MKNLILLGGLVLGAAVVLAKTEKGQELLQELSDKIDEKTEEAKARDAESRAKLEETLRRVGDDAVQRLADFLGISVEEVRASAARGKAAPRDDEETGGLGD